MNYNHVDHRDQIKVPLLEKEEKLDADCGHIAAVFCSKLYKTISFPGPHRTTAALSLATLDQSWPRAVCSQGIVWPC